MGGDRIFAVRGSVGQSQGYTGVGQKEFDTVQYLNSQIK